MNKGFKYSLQIVNLTLVVVCLMLVAGLIFYDRDKYLTTLRYWRGNAENAAKSAAEKVVDAASDLARVKSATKPGVDSETKDATGPTATPITFPFFRLLMDPTDLDRIDTLARHLVRQGMMLKNDKQWFKGRLVHNGSIHNVTVRLRGDLAAHWGGEKKSWRIKLKRKNLLDGYRELNFIIPFDRAFEIEHIAYQMARNLGLLVPDSGFAHLEINNIDYGLYLWAEQPGKEMLEKLGYPEGEIYTGDNVVLNTFGIPRDWDAHPSGYALNVQKGKNAALFGDRFREFLELSTVADDAAYENRIGDYVNVEKFARFSALAWLFGSDHAHAFDNIKYYYDPTVGLLEPIIYDVNVYPLGEWKDDQFTSAKKYSFDSVDSPIVQRIFSVHAISKRRNEILWNMLKNDRNGKYEPVERASIMYKAARPYLAQGVGHHDFATLDDLFQKRISALTTNRQALRAWLSFGRVFVDARVLPRAADSVEFQIFPDGLNDFRLKSIRLQGAESLSTEKGAVQLSLRDFQGREIPINSYSVRRTDGGAIIDLDGVAVWAKRDRNLKTIPTKWTLIMRFPGMPDSFLRESDYLRKVEMSFINDLTGQPIEPFLVRITPVAMNDGRQKLIGDAADVGKFVTASGLPFTVSGSILELREGTYTVNRDLVFPRGYGLRMTAGTTVEMAPDVSILVFGPADILGTADKPVVVRGQKGKAAWGSIGFIHSPQQSTVRHLHLSGGSESWIEGIMMTGQLCFHSSDVTISDSTIADAHADDALNIKKAKFEIVRSRFVNNAADGFDGDWVRGVVRQSRFENNGNDGVDLSGSTVVIMDSVFTGMGDKGVSVGERSRVHIVNTQIEKSKIGVASKDQSEVFAYGVNVLDNKTGVDVYKKKKIFGPGKAEIFGGVFDGNEKDFGLDGASTLTLTGVARIKSDLPPRVAANDQRIGDIGRNYQRDARGILYFQPIGDAAKQFAKGPDTKAQQVMGVAIPNLSSAPVGLFRRLEDIP